MGLCPKPYRQAHFILCLDTKNEARKIKPACAEASAGRPKRLPTCAERKNKYQIQTVCRSNEGDSRSAFKPSVFFGYFL
jgi:hypothetical protein